MARAERRAWAVILGFIGVASNYDGSAWGLEGVDPCRDRPFKRWYAEVAHLAKVIDGVIRPFYNDHFAMTDEQRELYAADDVLEKHNPCALQVKNAYKVKPNPGSCTAVMKGLSKCHRGDPSCGQNFLERSTVSLECLMVKAAHLLDGDPLIDYEGQMTVYSSATPFYNRTYAMLRFVEDSATFEAKNFFFQSVRKFAKLLALGYRFPYPVTLSGAICETSEVGAQSIASEIEQAGEVIDKKIRSFYALSPSDRLACAADELMWEGDECVAEIKKYYSSRDDEGDCGAYFIAASGRCGLDKTGAFDFAECLVVIQYMISGTECFITRLARDAAADFTSYSDEEVGGFFAFKEEYEYGLEGGWLAALEQCRELPKEGRKALQTLFKACKRLEQLCTFGCPNLGYA